MLRRSEIGERLKYLRTKNKYSQNYVAKNLFISQAAYSLIENALNGIVSDHIIALSSLYDVTTDYILKGDNILARKPPSQGFIPYFKIKAHAGNVKNFSGNLNQVETELYKIPGYFASKGYRLFEVEGDSMSPFILSGDILICQPQKDYSRILDGSVVLLVAKDSLLVKRLRWENEKSYFLFENDNPNEVEILKLNKKEIKELYIVKGKITNFPTHNSFLSIDNQKLISLEKSVEQLKKDLLKISEKLKI